MTIDTPAGDAPAADFSTPPRRRGGSMALAWLLLIAVSALWISLSFIPEIKGKPAHLDPADDPGAMIKLQGQMALGLKSMVPAQGAPAPATGFTSMNSVEQGLLPPDATPSERLRAAMVLGEVSGPDKARQITQEVLAQPDLHPDLRTDAEHLMKLLAVESGPARDALTTDERDNLVKRHHWAAEVALSRGLPDTDPARAPILAGARRAMLTASTAVITGGAGLLVGLVLLVIAVVLVATGQIKPRFDRQPAMPPGERAWLLQSLSLFLVVLLALQIVGEVIEHVTGLPTFNLLLWGALPVAWWARLRGMDRESWKTALGWRAPRGVITEIGAGIVGYIAGLPIFALGVIITVVIMLVSGAKPSHPVVEEAARGLSFWKGASLLMLGCLWAPICEETFFRGAMYTACRGWLNPILSAFLVAFFFAGIHPQGYAGVPALMGLAVVFALIREWRGSVIGSMTAHALSNGAFMTMQFILLGG